MITSREYYAISVIDYSPGHWMDGAGRIKIVLQIKGGKPRC
jgi:hypothetical protein